MGKWRKADDTISLKEVEYTDNLVCLAGSIEEADYITNKYKHTFSKFRLSIAKEKHLTVVFNRTEHIYAKYSLLSVADVPIKNGQQFKYLENKISSCIEEKDAIDIDHRISLAEENFKGWTKYYVIETFQSKYDPKPFFGY